MDCGTGQNRSSSPAGYSGTQRRDLEIFLIQAVSLSFLQVCNNGLASGEATWGAWSLVPSQQIVLSRNDPGRRRGASCTRFYFLSPHCQSDIVLFDSYHNPRRGQIDYSHFADETIEASGCEVEGHSSTIQRSQVRCSRQPDHSSPYVMNTRLGQILVMRGSSLWG